MAGAFVAPAEIRHRVPDPVPVAADESVVTRLWIGAVMVVIWMVS